MNINYIANQYAQVSFNAKPGLPLTTELSDFLKDVESEASVSLSVGDIEDLRGVKYALEDGEFLAQVPEVSQEVVEMVHSLVSEFIFEYEDE